MIVAAAEAFYSSLGFSKLWLTRFFNSGLLACSTYFAFSCVRLLFGPPDELVSGPAGVAFVVALSVLAAAQYVATYVLGKESAISLLFACLVGRVGLRPDRRRRVGFESVRLTFRIVAAPARACRVNLSQDRLWTGHKPALRL